MLLALTFLSLAQASLPIGQSGTMFYSELVPAHRGLLKIEWPKCAHGRPPLLITKEMVYSAKSVEGDGPREVRQVNARVSPNLEAKPCPPNSPTAIEELHVGADPRRMSHLSLFVEAPYKLLSLEASKAPANLR